MWHVQGEGRIGPSQHSFSKGSSCLTNLTSSCGQAHLEHEGQEVAAALLEGREALQKDLARLAQWLRPVG